MCGAIVGPWPALSISAKPFSVGPMSLAAARPLSLRARVGAYVALTKPRIIELLLVTTLPTMVVAARGMPPIGLMLATLIGGARVRGGAPPRHRSPRPDRAPPAQRPARRPPPPRPAPPPA